MQKLQQQLAEQVKVLGGKRPTTETPTVKKVLPNKLLQENRPQAVTTSRDSESTELKSNKIEVAQLLKEEIDQYDASTIIQSGLLE